MTKKNHSIIQRLKSFRFAFNGLRILFKEEFNSKIHLVAAIGVLIAGFIFNISAYEWIAVIFAVGLVFALELVNTAIEGLADFVSPNNHQQIKRIKDLSAASVLVGAIAALIIGLLIFIPKVIGLFQNI